MSSTSEKYKVIQPFSIVMPGQHEDDALLEKDGRLTKNVINDRMVMNAEAHSAMIEAKLIQAEREDG